MSRQIAFTVSGTPRPQPRPRFVRGRAVSIADRKTKMWSDAVLRAATTAFAHAGSEPIEGPIEVELVFRFEAQLPEAVGAAMPSRDVDNLAKLALDRMQDARLFLNDRQVVSLKASKVWAAKAGMGVRVKMADNRSQSFASARNAPLGGQVPDWLC